ncbi:MAG: DUF2442 domain-containing protein [Geobacter sp.]|nr:DUF2442 domain-containing protein [Geobacter sp.]
MNPYVTDVRTLDDYLLELHFENGEVRIFDVKPYLGKGVFAKLLQKSLFRTVRVVAGSVEWSGGIDLSYDTLYLESRPVKEGNELLAKAG